MNPHRFVVAAIAALVLLRPVAGTAQEPMSQAKTLYASADYEQALKVLEEIPNGREAHYYRALCLIALGRANDAEQQIASVFALDPMFVPAAGEVSPRITATFGETRRRLLPQIVRRTFNEARRLFQAGDREHAREQFELTLQMLDDSLTGEGSDLADLKLVASGFLDLLRSDAAPSKAAAPVASAQPLATAVEPPSAAPSRAASRIVTLPVAIEQTLPPWHPEGAMSRQSFDGLMVVQIDERGRVTGARMEKSSYAPYDRLLLTAARKWVYKPATMNGEAIPSEKTVEIHLRPSPPSR